jgi:hypothetical protein
MKNLLLGLALCGLTMACASEEKASVTGGGPAACPECDAGTCMECPTTGECSGDKKSVCSGSAEAKVCPVTGKVMN